MMGEADGRGKRAGPLRLGSSAGRRQGTRVECQRAIFQLPP
jgi:hypothetical protein